MLCDKGKQLKQKAPWLGNPGCEAGNYFTKQETVIAFLPNNTSTPPPSGSDHPGV